jgi:small-conductance mechanosensitive channel
MMIDNYMYYGILVFGTFTIAFILSYIIRRLLNIFILRYSKRLKADPTNFSFIKNSIGALIYSIAILFVFLKIPYLQSLGTALFAGAGIFAIVVGFACQEAFSNIISGIFILIFKPFRVNDTIEFLNSTKGVVEEITLRHTIIRNYENRRVIIPNGNISDDTIINSNILDEKIRMHIVFGISYDSNIEKATKIIQEESMNHPSFLDNRTDEDKQNNKPAVNVRLIELADFSVKLKAYVWSSNNDDAYALKCDVMKSVFDRFNKEGIEVHFPYRNIVYKNDIEEKKHS